MAASPTTTVNDDNPPHQQPLKHTDNWSMDVEPARDHMGPGGDMDTNGAPHPADERGAPGQEPADYPAPASVSGSTTDTAVARADAPQRGEKLIKVLIRSLRIVPFVVSSPLSSSLRSVLPVHRLARRRPARSPSLLCRPLPKLLTRRVHTLPALHHRRHLIPTHLGWPELAMLPRWICGIRAH